MPYIRNGQEVSRSAFWSLLMTDLADPETGDLMKSEYEDAKRAIIRGETIHAGQDDRNMSRYQMTNTPA